MQLLTRRGAENGVPLVLLAALILPATWVARGYGWVAPWNLTFGLYFGSALLGVLGVWFMVGSCRWYPALMEILGLVGGILVAAALSELAIRLFRSPAPPIAGVPSGLLEPDPRLGWRLVAGSEVKSEDGFEVRYVIDDRGFRTAPRSTPPRTGPNSPLLVTIGAERTFGVGVDSEATFTNRLADDLRFEGANLGVPYYGIDQMALVLEFNAIPRHPRLIVVAFTAPPGRPSMVPRVASEISAPEFINDHGALRLRTEDDDQRRLPAVAWLEANSALWAALYEADLWIGAEVEWGAASSHLRRVLERIHRLTETAHVPVMFVRLPTPRSADYPFVEDVLHSLGSTYVDLAGSHTRRPPDIFRADGTLSASGHRWVADSVRPALVRMLE